MHDKQTHSTSDTDSRTAEAVPGGCAVAIIMDGNGRWAVQRGLPVVEGHRQGGTALHDTVEAALDFHVEEMTVYAFSTENWSRSAEEVQALLQLFVELLDREVPDLHRQGVRIRFPGRVHELPELLQQRIEWAETTTADNDRMVLAIAFNYGGRAEIIDAARAIAREGGAEAIDEQSLSRAMYLPEMRDPDVIVRTAGEQRTSNFLVWQGVYSELVFVDTLWPDFGESQLRDVLLEYGQRDRRFGGRNAASQAETQTETFAGDQGRS